MQHFSPDLRVKSLFSWDSYIQTPKNLFIRTKIARTETKQPYKNKNPLYLDSVQVSVLICRVKM